MSRLIDADRLLFDVSNAFAELHIGKREILREDDILKVIYNAPVAEEHPVKHGRWIEENRRPKSSQFYCSECHRIAYDIQPNRAKGWVKRCRYAFCPHCGAMMDEEDDHDDHL